MKVRHSRNSLTNYRLAWPALALMLITSTVLVSGLLAQGGQNQQGMMQAQTPARVAPNWELSERWSWLLVSGIVDILLAGIIISGLPGTALWAIGLLVGINLVFGGATLIGMALAARKA